jgi:hypothetical protein
MATPMCPHVTSAIAHTGAYAVRPLRATLFRQYYDRADLPISLLHRAGGNRLKWHIKPDELDYHAYLPLFFDGLCEVGRGGMRGLDITHHVIPWSSCVRGATPSFSSKTLVMMS